MTEEQLIFQAARAAERARELAGDLWDGAAGDAAAQGRELSRSKCIALLQEANLLSCAAVALQRRSAGLAEPPRG